MNRRTRHGVVLLGLLWLFAMPLHAETPAPAQPLDGRTMETLLSADAAPDLRRDALQRLVARAQTGDGWAAYVLGALYRSGKDHPARLVERDPDTARHWLTRCVDGPRCPLLALASLAELELAEGNAKPAMQWAQAWVVLDRELAARTATEGKTSATSLRTLMRTSYHAYLIERCYRLMGERGSDGDSRGLAWFNELRADKGKALDRMFFAALDARSDLAGAIDGGLEPTAENQSRRSLEGSVPVARQPAMGIYLYRGTPGGGRAEAVETVETLPNPMKTFGLKALARDTRMTPYQAAAGERAYVVLPVALGQADYYLFEPK